MFNLIVAVISIALIAAMAAASIFYGGSAFGSGTAQAQASTLVNNGQQVSGAQQLYMIDNSGNRANDIDVLTPAYLQALPTAPSNSTGPNATDTGAWEIPVVCKRLADSGRYQAIIACGAVIRGATSHYDFVAGQAASGTAAVASQTGVPVIFGVLTTDTIEQAIERAGTKAGNKGFEAACAAIELVSLLRALEA